MMTADTAAKRAYLIRLACGDGFKTPEPMAAFAVRLTRQKRGAWDSAKVSRVESGERKLTLDDVDTYAAVDPLKRGRSWLAFGEEEAPKPSGRGPMGMDWVPVDPARVEAAKRSVAEQPPKGKRARPEDPSESPRRK